MGVSNTFHKFLKALPKCEHHLHIEGTLTPSLLFELSRQNNVTLPSTPAYESISALQSRYQAFTSLQDFLDHYYVGMSVLLTRSDFALLTYTYLKSTHADGVRHVEMFFDPQAHLERGIPYAVILEGIEQGIAQAKSQFPDLTVLLIACFLRHLGSDEALKTLALLAPDLKSGRITGVGLDSSEAGFPAPLFKEVYAQAAALTLHLTAHAGEETPHTAITDTLEALHVTRIDHGLTSATSPALLTSLAASKTMLTLCPLSNVCLCCIPSVKEFPIRAFLDAGVRFSINGDDPAYFRGGVLDNYLEVQRVWGLNVREWEKIVKGSVEGSWCSKERKVKLRGELEKVVETYEPLIRDEVGGRSMEEVEAEAREETVAVEV
ncbi:MAG: adenine deaminase [Cirrosporium novae-zelandiae]|nr:MAG: adenine deaminase [Cirrosporium novae-zelandiae]